MKVFKNLSLIFGGLGFVLFGACAIVIISLISLGCDDSKIQKIGFPQNFMWGAATSAHQIEGNNTNNDWWQWEQQEAPLGFEEKSGLASNSYVLFDIDSQLVAELNLDAYRFSIEWSRIEPEKNIWDEKEIQHYREVIDSLLLRNIIPVVTLHHFTNPIWIQNLEVPGDGLGGWLNEETALEFAEFAGKMAEEFGDRVDYWITINEPVLVATGAYLIGGFPPGHMNLSNVFEEVIPALINFIKGHALAYDAIKQKDLTDADGDGKSAIVGMAKAMVIMDPADPSSQDDIKAAQRFDLLFNRLYLDAIIDGKLDADLDGVQEEYHPEWKGRLNFLGINYYNRWYVLNLDLLPPVNALPCITFPGLDLSGFGCPQIIGETSDTGSELYPEGIYRVVTEMGDRYGLPILITENGIATTEGEKRARFIVNHLSYLKKAMDEGKEVFGYFHWSLIDNYEWGSFTPRFGLYTVDCQNNFNRTINKGGEIYAEIARTNEMSKEILLRYGK